MKPLFYILMFMCSPLLSVAQGFEGDSWMSHLDDARTVASLSIPGAHDAATGEGVRTIAGVGRTQELSIAELWDCGVRAFDLRPAVNGEELHIYHGIAKTKVSFCDALDVLCRKLEEKPCEFAIVLLREENESENSAECALWPYAVGKAIVSLGNLCARFSPSMSVGEARGKIIFLSRNAYEGCDKGAVISGWSHSADGTVDAMMTSYATGTAARLQLQDFYLLTNNKRRQAKRDAVLRFMTLAGEVPADVWTINFISGYCNRWLGFTPFATTAGYKRNAETMHSLVLEAFEAGPQRTGILMMDFAGCDKVRGSMFHWGAFDTRGAEIVKRIIGLNF